MNGITNLDNRNIVERKLKYRKFLAVGDSYGDESGEWASAVPSVLGISSNSWTNLCVGGAGFVSNGTLLFINQITNYAGDRNEITDIIVCGGLNDSKATSPFDSFYTSVTTNMTAFDTYVRSNYPNAKISLGYIGNGIDSSQYIENRTYEARQTCKYIYNDTGSELGWTILHNVEFALCTNLANIASDGVHPSTFGNEALSYAIAQAILSGSCDVRYPNYPAVANNAMIKYAIDNNQTVLSFKDYYKAIPNGTSIAATSLLETCTELYFNHVTEIPCSVRLDGFDSKSYQFYPGRLLLTGTSIYLEINGTDASGNYILSHTATDANGYIRIVNVDTVISTEYLA